MADSLELFFAEWRNVSQNKQADQLARQAIKKEATWSQITRLLLFLFDIPS